MGLAVGLLSHLRLQLEMHDLLNQKEIRGQGVEYRHYSLHHQDRLPLDGRGGAGRIDVNQLHHEISVLRQQKGWDANTIHEV